MLLPILAVVMLFASLGAAYGAYRAWGGDETLEGGDWQARVAALGRRVRAGGDEAQRKELVSRLQAAGIRDSDAADLFMAIQLFAVLVMLAIGFGVAGVFIRDLQDVLLLVVGAVAIGYLVPLWLLDGRAEARRRAILASLPGAVDLLVSTIEAGLSVEHALERVGAAIADSDQMLADELEVSARELAAGIPLEEAMRRLGRRVGLDELQGLTAVIAQASVLGSRIGQSLRDYSDVARKQRIATLEERAGKLSARLTLPIVFCLVPACLLIIIAPAVVDAIRAFGSAN